MGTGEGARSGWQRAVVVLPHARDTIGLFARSGAKYGGAKATVKSVENKGTRAAKKESRENIIVGRRLLMWLYKITGIYDISWLEGLGGGYCISITS